MHNARILVDADACPVKDIIVKVAKEFNLKVIMFTDTSHIIEDGYSQVITVSQGKDAVDIALINQNGLIYNEANIDRLLMERYIAQKVRRAGGRTYNPKKRSEKANISFERSLRKLCKSILNM